MFAAGLGYYLIRFIVYGAIAVLGLFAGKKLREGKNAKTAAEEK